MDIHDPGFQEFIDYRAERRWRFREFQEHKAAIIDKYLNGQTTRQIGKEYDVSTSHVRIYLKEWDVILRKQQKSKYPYKQSIINKSKNMCSLCGERDKAVLVFHHRNPTEKIGTISSMLKNSAPVNELKAEIAKCITLCRNCHSRIHSKQFKDVLKEMKLVQQ